jgi:hypothetical protein
MKSWYIYYLSLELKILIFKRNNLLKGVKQESFRHECYHGVFVPHAQFPQTSGKMNNFSKFVRNSLSVLINIEQSERVGIGKMGNAILYMVEKKWYKMRNVRKTEFIIISIFQSLHVVNPQFLEK